MTKKEIRSSILKIRRNMTASEVKAASTTICEKLTILDMYKDAVDICLYMSIQNEVDLLYLLDDISNQNKRVWLPRILDEKMEFYLYNRDIKLVEGAYHILEPDSTIKLQPDKHTLIIMPGSVFSTNGDRIGYGGGYYDRYILENKQSNYVAVCYDFQILDTIPCEEHDQKPSAIVSEKRVIYI